MHTGAEATYDKGRWGKNISVHAHGCRGKCQWDEDGPGRDAHIWKQPWHLTSMKKELGDCTNRFRLFFCFSSSTGGCRRSMSLDSTCAQRNKRVDYKASTLLSEH